MAGEGEKRNHDGARVSLVAACSATARRALVEANRSGSVWPSARVRATNQAGGSGLRVPTPRVTAPRSLRFRKRSDGALCPHACVGKWESVCLPQACLCKIMGQATDPRLLGVSDCAGRPRVRYRCTPPPPSRPGARILSSDKTPAASSLPSCVLSPCAAMEATERRGGAPLATASARRGRRRGAAGGGGAPLVLWADEEPSAA